MEKWILNVINFLKQLSYPGIVMALTLEFVPAELVLPLAGYWVYQGDFKLIPTILAGAIGGTLGPLTLYALGRYGGRPFIQRFGKYLFIREKQIIASDQFFEKYGGGVAFLGRFLPGVRTLISIPCGMAKMNVMVFSVYTFLAMVPITALYVYLGYKLGPEWEHVAPIAKQYMTPLALFLLLIITLYVWVKYRNKRKLV
jgi:membrane protein DedA with SNARE-associated domain